MFKSNSKVFSMVGRKCNIYSKNGNFLESFKNKKNFQIRSEEALIRCKPNNKHENLSGTFQKPGLGLSFPFFILFPVHIYKDLFSTSKARKYLFSFPSFQYWLSDYTYNIIKLPPRKENQQKSKIKKKSVSPLYYPRAGFFFLSIYNSRKNIDYTTHL